MGSCGHPSKTRRVTIKKLWQNPEWRAKQIEKKKGNRAWSPERRKKQSEIARQLNATMPKAMRKSNHQKISVARKEWCNANRAKMREYALKSVKRDRDFKKAIEVLEPWGITVDDTVTQAQLDEIFEIFL